MQNLFPLTRGQLMSITGFVAHLSSHFAHQLSVISKWEKRHQAALFWRAVQTLGLILSSKSYYVASAQVEHFSLVLSHRCCWLHPSLDVYVLSNMHNLFVEQDVWLTERFSSMFFFMGNPGGAVITKWNQQVSWLPSPGSLIVLQIVFTAEIVKLAFPRGGSSIVNSRN